MITAIITILVFPLLVVSVAYVKIRNNYESLKITWHTDSKIHGLDVQTFESVISNLNHELSKYKPRSRLEVWQDAIDDANNVFDGETPKPQEIDDYILAVIQSQTEAK